MAYKEQIIQTWQQVQGLFIMLETQYPDWYASLRIPALELERRLKDFIKEMADE